ncbi:two-component sensor [Pseudomonas aeruginosa]|nr:two-component sensor [Pseudomonas aeruginosa]
MVREFPPPTASGSSSASTGAATAPAAAWGLAIVGEVCRAHRAQIQLDQGELGGLLVRVRFPAE